MAHDPRPVRYFVYLNLFVTAMLILVLANNYLLLFLGWEGVGLCSYLLIGHYFERREARDLPRLKAFVVNRIGDFGLMLAILAIFQHFGTLDLQASASTARSRCWSGRRSPGCSAPIGAVTAIAFLMLVGVTGKSAQIPLFVWLPDAMAGPTPASALIHAATMVTSGVYLIVRNPRDLCCFAGDAESGRCGIGVLTALRGGVDRDRPVRHQERAGLLDGLAARLHGRGRGHGRVRRRRCSTC